MSGLLEAVEVLWDRWGVPHIYAQNTHDLYFAQGYVTASQRLFQMELMLRLGSGRLAELFGEMTLPFDRFIRTVGWNRVAGRAIRQWDDLSLELSEAWAAGVRAWVEGMPAKPIEYEILQVDPFTPEPEDAAQLGAAAGVFMAWSLSTNWDAELLRAEIAERLGWEAMATLFPDPPTDPPAVHPGKEGGPRGRRSGLDLLRGAPAFPSGQGSNNWVVSGKRSASGKPLLANDPHILVQAPSPWFEVHLSAPGIDVRGVSLPFSTGVLIGHNDRIAWGATNVGGDTQDLYLERLDESQTAALYEGMWEPLTIHREEIAVRGRAEAEVIEVRGTRHGPILDSYLVGLRDVEVVEGGISHAYALRWVAAEEGIVKFSTIHKLNTAANFEEFRAALSGWVCPGQNFVYGDVDGNIGYQCSGWHPIRRRGDGTVPVPGWLSEYEWDGYVPFEEMPWSYNPEEGFLATANARPHDESYPYTLGRDFLPPFRARRVAQLITTLEKHDTESFGRIQVDTLSLPAREIVPLLVRVEPTDERQKEALALLANWDFDLTPGSAAAALYEVWCVRLAEAILRPRLGEELYRHFYSGRQWSNEFHVLVLPRLLEFPTDTWFGADGAPARDRTLLRTLDQALDELTQAMGEDTGRWQWGEIHRARFVGHLGEAVPDLAEAFTAGVSPHGGDEQTVNQGLFEPGDHSYDAVVCASWRQIIDLSNLDASVGTLTVGQSGNPASPHWNDQFPLWSTGRYHPLPFTRPAVENESESRLALLPE